MTKARDLANAGTALTSVSATELGYLDGVTSAVQTQLNAKQAVVSGVDSTEIGYLDGVTSSIQTQLNSKIGQATAINPTIVDAKGDIIAATAADTVARLAVGSNNTVLTADSSTATGLKWATPAAGGKVLQVVQFTTTTASTVTSSTFTDTNITLSITPSASTSKIMVIASCATQYFTNGAGLNQVGMGLRLKRGATVVFDPSGNGGEAEYITDSENSYKQMSAFTTFSYLDSPATTSSTTYTIAIRNNASTNTAKTSPDSRESSLILMEIGA